MLCINASHPAALPRPQVNVFYGTRENLLLLQIKFTRLAGMGVPWAFLWTSPLAPSTLRAAVYATPSFCCQIYLRPSLIFLVFWVVLV